MIANFPKPEKTNLYPVNGYLGDHSFLQGVCFDYFWFSAAAVFFLAGVVATLLAGGAVRFIGNQGDTDRLFQRKYWSSQYRDR